MKKITFALALLITAYSSFNCSGDKSKGSKTTMATLDSVNTKKPGNTDHENEKSDDDDFGGDMDDDMKKMSDDFTDMVKDFEDDFKDVSDDIKKMGDDFTDIANKFQEHMPASGTTKTRITNNIKRKMHSNISFKVYDGKVVNYDDDILIKLYEKRGDKEVKALLKDKDGKFMFKVIEDKDSLIAKRYQNQKNWLKVFLNSMNDKKEKDRDFDEDFGDWEDDGKMTKFNAKDKLMKKLHDQTLKEADLLEIVEQIYMKVTMSGDQKYLLKKVIRHNNFTSKVGTAIKDDIDQLQLTSDRKNVLETLAEREGQ